MGDKKRRAASIVVGAASIVVQHQYLNAASPTLEETYRSDGLRNMFSRPQEVAGPETPGIRDLSLEQPAESKDERAEMDGLKHMFIDSR